MTSKKHQLKSDRSLGLLLTEIHDIIDVIYLNNPPTDDPALDDLGSAVQTWLVWQDDQIARPAD
jgi:hypothetical protein